MTLSKSLTAIAVALVLVVAYFVSVSTPRADAQAMSGLPATVATTSLAAVTSTGSSIIATSSCSARIITTNESAIRLTFSDYAGQTPTGVFGHTQLASTTEAYPSSQYGCGLVKAYSYTSQTLTVTDAR